MTQKPFIKPYLMTAGPTPLPPQVSQALAEPMLYHRAPAFAELYARVLANLRKIFETQNEVLLFTASGTGAMESAVANLVAPGTPVLACAAGKFGERWAEICEAYDAVITRYEPGWGERLDPSEIAAILDQNSEIKLVFATHSETSTGVVHDIAAIAEVVREHGGILVVDAISSVAGAELRQDEWGIDVVVAGSQKALMCPPGLAFVSASERALAQARSNSRRAYYFDWQLTVGTQTRPAPDSPFTPAVGIVRALDVALEMILEEGLGNVLKRHRVLAAAARAGIGALGLSLYGDPDERSTIVTAAELPDSIDGSKVPKLLREQGVTANGGQGQIAGRIIRVAHCGYFGAFDIIVFLSALEMTLTQLGYQVENGAAVGAAEKVFLEARVALTPSA